MSNSMEAYTFRYKGEMPKDWRIEPNDFHECMSDECCYSPAGAVPAGIPMYRTMSDLLHVLVFDEWHFSIGEGKKAEYIDKGWRGKTTDLFQEAQMMTILDKLNHLKEGGFTVHKVTLVIES